MPEGNGIIYLGLVLAIVGVVVSILRFYTRDEKLIRVAQIASIALFGVLTASVAFLYYLFISGDVSYEYVWEYTKTDHELKYKVSGTIAGMAGSLLFWAWMIAIPWFYEELRAMRRPVDQDVMDWTRVAVLMTIIAFLYILSVGGVFRPTRPELLAIAPDGNGLSPLLQTDLMVIHPPVVFFAYGFLVIPFAAAFANLATGKRDWLGMSVRWSRWGWFFLTLGIGIGGLWAYVVLGWGGYWGWDPVETSSLLPWLLLTGFLHAQLMYKRKGKYPVLAPLLGIFTFILVVFATFATRAGGLWVSVHTFGSVDDITVSVWERFAEILENNPTIKVYLLFIIIAVALAAALAIWRYLKTRRKQEEKYITLSELVSDDMLMDVTVILFILTTFVTWLILLGGVNGLSADNFNTPIGLLALAGMLVLFLCLAWRDLGRTRVLQIAGITLLASLVLGVAFISNVGIAASMPILLVSLGGVGYKAIKSFNKKRRVPSLALVSAHLIHISIVLILIGYVGSTFLQDEQTVPLVEDGEPEEVFGYSIEVSDVDVDPAGNFIWVEVDVYKNGRFVGKERPGAQRIQGQVRSEIRVVDTLTEDVYLTYINASTGSGGTMVNMNIKVLPLMNVLWAGLYLMALGIIGRMGFEAWARMRRRSPASDSEQDEDLELSDEGELDEEGEYEEDEEELEEETEPEEDRDDSYYEDLLEAELKRD
jgi:cytochrome c-type biogenesis protein CcmF